MVGFQSITIVGCVLGMNQDDTPNYKIAFFGPFSPRYGKLTGYIAGTCSVDKEMFDFVSGKKFPYACHGTIIQNAKNYQYELVTIAE